jgi:hypothetical protein
MVAVYDFLVGILTENILNLGALPPDNLHTFFITEVRQSAANNFPVWRNNLQRIAAFKPAGGAYNT